MKPSARLKLAEIVLFGILGAMTFAAKFVMSALPNIEPVSLLVMLFAVIFGRKAVYPISVYIVMEFMVYGLGIWNVYYLYIWFVLALAARLMRKCEQPVYWALLSGGFGLLFGALCAVADAFIGGVGYAVAKWTSGILFDITHSVGNFIIALLLFGPMRKLLGRLYGLLQEKK